VHRRPPPPFPYLAQARRKEISAQRKEAEADRLRAEASRLREQWAVYVKSAEQSEMTA
jgi:hypothetical protein